MKKYVCILGVFFMNVVDAEYIVLPTANMDSSMSVKQAISERRSVRAFKNEPLTMQELSQLLWSAQGITNKSKGLRAAPSAGALYPCELYIVVGNVADLAAGVYKYVIGKHELVKISDGDKRTELASVSLSQMWIATAPATIVVVGIIERISRKYGKAHAPQYVHIEVGAIAENVYLQGRVLGIGTTFVGAFDDNNLKRLLGAPADEEPFAVLPLGKI